MPAKEMLRIRDKTIAEFRNLLDDVEPSTAPRWLLTLMLTPVFLWEVGKAVFRFSAGVVMATCFSLVAMILTPFAALYALFDVLVILVWFFRRMLDKMTGEKE